MPTYDYECTECGHVFEVFQSIKARPLKKLKDGCEQCKRKAPVRRLIGTGAAVLFKGSGFYETDYRSESYKKAAKAEKEAASGKKPHDKKSGDKKSDANKSGTDGARSASAKADNKPGTNGSTKKNAGG